MSVRLSCVDVVPTIDDVRLDALPVTIGRGNEADLCVHDTWASRVHCVLFERDGQLWVRDLQSSNGTRVNGRAVDEARILNGDRLTIGITTLRVAFQRLPKPSRQPLAAAVSG